MTQHTKEAMTPAQLVLRVAGVALASVVAFLLLTVLDGGSGTAEAASRPGGLGDARGAEASNRSVPAPIVGPAADVVTPIVDAIEPPVPVIPPVPAPAPPGLTTVVTPVLDVVAPIAQTVAPPIANAVASVADTVAPIADDVADTVRPVDPPAADPVRPTDDAINTVVPVVPPAADTHPPIVDNVDPPGTDTVLPPTPPSAGEPGAVAAPVASIDVDTVSIVEVDTLTPAVAAADSAASPNVIDAAPIADLSEPVREPALDSRVVASEDFGARSITGANPRSEPFGPFPTGSSAPGALPSIVTGLLSGATSSAPSPGAPSVMLAVLTATVAAMSMLSRRVTTEVSWRSVLVLSSVERPG